MHSIVSCRSRNTASKAVVLLKKNWMIQIYLDEMKIFLLLWDIFYDSCDSTAEKAEHVAQETSNSNLDRTSNDLKNCSIDKIRLKCLLHPLLSMGKKNRKMITRLWVGKSI